MITEIYFQALGIDQIVLEEAALARCKAGRTVRELIEKAYWDYFNFKPGFEELEESNESEPSRLDFEVALESIKRKFFALVSLK